MALNPITVDTLASCCGARQLFHFPSDDKYYRDAGSTPPTLAEREANIRAALNDPYDLMAGMSWIVCILSDY